MKIMIAIPCMDSLDVDFVNSLENLERVGMTRSCFHASSLVYAARDQLATVAVTQKDEYVLWLDSDMVFDASLLKDLIETLKNEKADVVSGLFFQRRPPFEPALWKTCRIGLDGEHETEKYRDYPRREPFEIEACGMAAVLMKTEVLEACIQKYNTAFQPIPGFGEDISFCLRARDLGYKLICDPRIKVSHIGRSVINEVTYRHYNHMDDHKEV